MSDDKSQDVKAPETPDKPAGNAPAASPAPAKKIRRWMRILGWVAVVIVVLLVVSPIVQEIYAGRVV